MKKYIMPILRKHGSRGRASMHLARFPIRQQEDSRDGLPGVKRSQRRLAFESSCQAYLWITDRGRSRLIKH